MAVWSDFKTPPAVFTQLQCSPIVPGSLIIVANDGINDKTLTDNGDGELTGDGTGLISYDYGYVGFEFTDPQPSSGTQILADYDSAEGGCYLDCVKCLTNYVKLSVTPGEISGSDQFTIVDAWSRLFEKIKRDILPIHVRIWPELIDEFYSANIVYRFDLVDGDEEVLDTTGLHAILDDSSW